MDVSALHYATLVEVAGLIKARDLSPVELTRHMLGRIDAVDPSLHAYLAVTGKSAVAEAEQAEAELRSGRYRGPLHGVPIAIKDLFHTRGTPSTFGSLAYKEFVGEGRRDRGSAPAQCRRGDPWQAASARGRVRRASPRAAEVPQSLEQRLLAGRLVLRFRRGDRGRTLLRQPRHRHGRIDPLSFGRQRRHRPQADMGPDEPRRRLPARRIARHHWADGENRGRRRGDIRRFGWLRSERPDQPRRAGP